MSLAVLWERALEWARSSPLVRPGAAARALVAELRCREAELGSLTDAELTSRARRLRERKPSPHPVVLLEAMPLGLEAAHRALGQRLHDCQIHAALALCEGMVAELATGEGKTLAAVPAAFVLSLEGRGLHVLTFNDYLARRDAGWMGPVYALLGTSVGCIQENDGPETRRAAYAADVTYATAKQAGFDTLRDLLVQPGELRVLRGHHAAIVDEADSLLIDDARVPMVLAGGELEASCELASMTELAQRLVEHEDFERDGEARNVQLTASGVERVERELGLDDLHAESARDTLTALNLALHARVLLQRDVDYIVRERRVEVVDELTGRVVSDRRFPDGLHAALEVKEGLPAGLEGHVLLSLTLHHFFAMYGRLAGMTATALPAADELLACYGLRTAPIAPHLDVIREERADRIFADAASKWEAVVGEIEEELGRGRPVLVGTTSVAASEDLAARLRARGLTCEVLNARNDEDEARIIAEAGRPAALTISTNMAGRGTDIRLGGADETERERVLAVVGLHVIGTSRHESRRIDDQLRGRSGRQGEPGSSRFFLSLEDTLVQRHGAAELVEPLRALLGGGETRDPAASVEIARAQRVIEGEMADLRATLRRYSSMIEEQRAIHWLGREGARDADERNSVLERHRPAPHASVLAHLRLPAVHEAVQRVSVVEHDRAWRRHLVRIADVKEGIHLHSLVGHDAFGGLITMRKTPLDAFHEAAIAVFDATRRELEESLVATLLSLGPSETGLVLDRDELKGPQSTWTYLTTDTAFESTVIRMARGAKRRRAS